MRMLDSAQLKAGTFKTDRIGSALRGENPTLITQMRSGFVFLAENIKQKLEALVQKYY
jgi:hypothetical protein